MFLTPINYIFYSFTTILFIYIIYFIKNIINKKWIDFVLNFIGFIFIVVIFIIRLLYFNLESSFSSILNKNTEIGNFQFYRNEVFKRTNIEIEPNLKIISKIDTIYFSGFEKEYNAECLYSGSIKSIIEIENIIKSQEEFIKIDSLDEYPTSVIKEENFKANEIKSVYKKEMEGSYIIWIAFNKANSKFYYYGYYY